ncbi:MAG: DUF1385 domain-containing protein [Desulfomonilaceae bacterium]|nr:DUF1385 domain-containing protein [Desulfomonilaceae bacterium]
MLIAHNSSEDKPLIKVGGQAVIEGIMMRAPKTLTVVVRKACGDLSVREDRWYSPMEKWPILKKPLLRGCIVLYEALYNGIQALTYSAQEALDEEEEKLGPWALGGTIALALAGAMLLFVVIPHLATLGMGALAGTDLGVRSVWFHVIDGIIKVTIFVGYILVISLIGEIRRVFQYHGAEHKSIHAYEKGEELTVENARKYPTLHARCGTAFLLLVLVLSIFLFTAVFPLLPKDLFGNKIVTNVFFILVKIVLMVPIAGCSYEIIRLGDRFNNPVLNFLLLPGLWLQKLTTREPSDDQIEVALVALRKTLEKEETWAETESSAC